MDRAESRAAPSRIEVGRTASMENTRDDMIRLPFIGTFPRTRRDKIDESKIPSTQSPTNYRQKIRSGIFGNRTSRFLEEVKSSEQKGTIFGSLPRRKVTETCTYPEHHSSLPRSHSDMKTIKSLIKETSFPVYGDGRNTFERTIINTDYRRSPFAIRSPRSNSNSRASMHDYALSSDEGSWSAADSGHIDDMESSVLSTASSQNAGDSHTDEQKKKKKNIKSLGKRIKKGLYSLFHKHEKRDRDSGVDDIRQTDEESNRTYCSTDSEFDRDSMSNFSYTSSVSRNNYGSNATLSQTGPSEDRLSMVSSSTLSNYGNDRHKAGMRRVRSMGFQDKKSTLGHFANATPYDKPDGDVTSVSAQNQRKTYSHQLGVSPGSSTDIVDRTVQDRTVLANTNIHEDSNMRRSLTSEKINKDSKVTNRTSLPFMGINLHSKKSQEFSVSSQKTHIDQTASVEDRTVNTDNSMRRSLTSEKINKDSKATNRTSLPFMGINLHSKKSQELSASSQKTHLDQTASTSEDVSASKSKNTSKVSRGLFGFSFPNRSNKSSSSQLKSTTKNNKGNTEGEDTSYKTSQERKSLEEKHGRMFLPILSGPKASKNRSVVVVASSIVGMSPLGQLSDSSFSNIEDLKTDHLNDNIPSYTEPDKFKDSQQHKTIANFLERKDPRTQDLSPARNNNQVYPSAKQSGTENSRLNNIPGENSVKLTTSKREFNKHSNSESHQLGYNLLHNQRTASPKSVSMHQRPVPETAATGVESQISKEKINLGNESVILSQVTQVRNETKNEEKISWHTKETSGKTNEEDHSIKEDKAKTVFQYSTESNYDDDDDDDDDNEFFDIEEPTDKATTSSDGDNTDLEFYDSVELAPDTLGQIKEDSSGENKAAFGYSSATQIKTSFEHLSQDKIHRQSEDTISSRSEISFSKSNVSPHRLHNVPNSSAPATQAFKTPYITDNGAEWIKRTDYSQVLTKTDDVEEIKRRSDIIVQKSKNIDGSSFGERPTLDLSNRVNQIQRTTNQSKAVEELSKFNEISSSSRKTVLSTSPSLSATRKTVPSGNITKSLELFQKEITKAGKQPIKIEEKTQISTREEKGVCVSKHGRDSAEEPPPERDKQDFGVKPLKDNKDSLRMFSGADGITNAKYRGIRQTEESIKYISRSNSENIPKKEVEEAAIINDVPTRRSDDIKTENQYVGEQSPGDQSIENVRKDDIDENKSKNIIKSDENQSRRITNDNSKIKVDSETALLSTVRKSDLESTANDTKNIYSSKHPKREKSEKSWKKSSKEKTDSYTEHTDGRSHKEIAESQLPHPEKTKSTGSENIAQKFDRPEDKNEANLGIGATENREPIQKEKPTKSVSEMTQIFDASGKHLGYVSMEEILRLLSEKLNLPSAVNLDQNTSKDAATSVTSSLHRKMEGAPAEKSFKAKHSSSYESKDKFDNEPHRHTSSKADMLKEKEFHDHSKIDSGVDNKFSKKVSPKHSSESSPESSSESSPELSSEYSTEVRSETSSESSTQASIIDKNEHLTILSEPTSNDTSTEHSVESSPELSSECSPELSSECSPELSSESSCAELSGDSSSPDVNSIPSSEANSETESDQFHSKVSNREFSFEHSRVLNEEDKIKDGDTSSDFKLNFVSENKSSDDSKIDITRIIDNKDSVDVPNKEDRTSWSKRLHSDSDFAAKNESLDNQVEIDQEANIEIGNRDLSEKQFKGSEKALDTSLDSNTAHKTDKESKLQTKIDAVDNRKVNLSPTSTAENLNNMSDLKHHRSEILQARSTVSDDVGVTSKEVFTEFGQKQKPDDVNIEQIVSEFVDSKHKSSEYDLRASNHKSSDGILTKTNDAKNSNSSENIKVIEISRSKSESIECKEEKENKYTEPNKPKVIRKYSKSSKHVDIDLLADQMKEADVSSKTDKLEDSYQIVSEQNKVKGDKDGKTEEKSRPKQNRKSEQKRNKKKNNINKTSRNNENFSSEDNSAKSSGADIPGKTSSERPKRSAVESSESDGSNSLAKSTSKVNRKVDLDNERDYKKDTTSDNSLKEQSLLLSQSNVVEKKLASDSRSFEGICDRKIKPLPVKDDNVKKITGQISPSVNNEQIMNKNSIKDDSTVLSDKENKIMVIKGRDKIKCDITSSSDDSSSSGNVDKTKLSRSVAVNVKKRVSFDLKPDVSKHPEDTKDNERVLDTKSNYKEKKSKHKSKMKTSKNIESSSAIISETRSKIKSENSLLTKEKNGEAICTEESNNAPSDIILIESSNKETDGLKFFERHQADNEVMASVKKEKGATPFKTEESKKSRSRNMTAGVEISEIQKASYLSSRIGSIHNESKEDKQFNLPHSGSEIKGETREGLGESNFKETHDQTNDTANERKDFISACPEINEKELEIGNLNVKDQNYAKDITEETKLGTDTNLKENWGISRIQNENFENTSCQKIKQSTVGVSEKELDQVRVYETVSNGTVAEVRHEGKDAVKIDSVKDEESISKEFKENSLSENKEVNFISSSKSAEYTEVKTSKEAVTKDVELDGNEQNDRGFSNREGESCAEADIDKLKVEQKKEDSESEVRIEKKEARIIEDLCKYAVEGITEPLEVLNTQYVENTEISMEIVYDNVADVSIESHEIVQINVGESLTDPVNLHCNDLMEDLTTSLSDLLEDIRTTPTEVLENEFKEISVCPDDICCKHSTEMFIDVNNEPEVLQDSVCVLEANTLETPKESITDQNERLAKLTEIIDYEVIHVGGGMELSVSIEQADTVREEKRDISDETKDAEETLKSAQELYSTESTEPLQYEEVSKIVTAVTRAHFKDLERNLIDCLSYSGDNKVEYCTDLVDLEDIDHEENIIEITAVEHSRIEGIPIETFDVASIDEIISFVKLVNTISEDPIHDLTEPVDIVKEVLANASLEPEHVLCQKITETLLESIKSQQKLDSQSSSVASRKDDSKSFTGDKSQVISEEKSDKNYSPVESQQSQRTSNELEEHSVKDSKELTGKVNDKSMSLCLESEQRGVDSKITTDKTSNNSSYLSPTNVNDFNESEKDKETLNDQIGSDDIETSKYKEKLANEDSNESLETTSCRAVVKEKLTCDKDGTVNEIDDKELKTNKDNDAKLTVEIVGADNELSKAEIIEGKKEKKEREEKVKREKKEMKEKEKREKKEKKEKEKQEKKEKKEMEKREKLMKKEKERQEKIERKLKEKMKKEGKVEAEIMEENRKKNEETKIEEKEIRTTDIVEDTKRKERKNEGVENIDGVNLENREEKIEEMSVVKMEESTKTEETPVFVENKEKTIKEGELRKMASIFERTNEKDFQERQTEEVLVVDGKEGKERKEEKAEVLSVVERKREKGIIEEKSKEVLVDKGKELKKVEVIEGNEEKKMKEIKSKEISVVERKKEKNEKEEKQVFEEKKEELRNEEKTEEVLIVRDEKKVQLEDKIKRISSVADVKEKQAYIMKEMKNENEAREEAEGKVDREREKISENELVNLENESEVMGDKERNNKEEITMDKRDKHDQQQLSLKDRNEEEEEEEFYDSVDISPRESPNELPAELCEQNDNLKPNESSVKTQDLESVTPPSSTQSLKELKSPCLDKDATLSDTQESITAATVDVTKDIDIAKQVTETASSSLPDISVASSTSENDSLKEQSTNNNDTDDRETMLSQRDSKHDSTGLDITDIALAKQEKAKDNDITSISKEATATTATTTVATKTSATPTVAKINGTDLQSNEIEETIDTSDSTNILNTGQNKYVPPQRESCEDMSLADTSASSGNEKISYEKPTEHKITTNMEDDVKEISFPEKVENNREIALLASDSEAEMTVPTENRSEELLESAVSENANLNNDEILVQSIVHESKEISPGISTTDDTKDEVVALTQANNVSSDLVEKGIPHTTIESYEEEEKTQATPTKSGVLYAVDALKRMFGFSSSEEPETCDKNKECIITSEANDNRQQLDGKKDSVCHDEDNVSVEVTKGINERDTPENKDSKDSEVEYFDKNDRSDKTDTYLEEQISIQPTSMEDKKEDINNANKDIEIESSKEESGEMKHIGDIVSSKGKDRIIPCDEIIQVSEDEDHASSEDTTDRESSSESSKSVEESNSEISEPDSAESSGIIAADLEEMPLFSPQKISEEINIEDSGEKAFNEEDQKNTFHEEISTNLNNKIEESKEFITTEDGETELKLSPVISKIDNLEDGCIENMVSVITVVTDEDLSGDSLPESDILKNEDDARPQSVDSDVDAEFIVTSSGSSDIVTPEEDLEPKIKRKPPVPLPRTTSKSEAKDSNKESESSEEIKDSIETESMNDYPEDGQTSVESKSKKPVPLPRSGVKTAESVNESSETDESIEEQFKDLSSRFNMLPPEMGEKLNFKKKPPKLPPKSKLSGEPNSTEQINSYDDESETNDSEEIKDIKSRLSMLPAEMGFKLNFKKKTPPPPPSKLATKDDKTGEIPEAVSDDHNEKEKLIENIEIKEQDNKIEPTSSGTEEVDDAQMDLKRRMSMLSAEMGVEINLRKKSPPSPAPKVKRGDNSTNAEENKLTEGDKGSESIDGLEQVSDNINNTDDSDEQSMDLKSRLNKLSNEMGTQVTLKKSAPVPPPKFTKDKTKLQSEDDEEEMDLKSRMNKLSSEMGTEINLKKTQKPPVPLPKTAAAKINSVTEVESKDPEESGETSCTFVISTSIDDVECDESDSFTFVINSDITEDQTVSAISDSSGTKSETTTDGDVKTADSSANKVEGDNEDSNSFTFTINEVADSDKPNSYDITICPTETNEAPVVEEKKPEPEVKKELTAEEKAKERLKRISEMLEEERKKPKESTVDAMKRRLSGSFLQEEVKVDPVKRRSSLTSKPAPKKLGNLENFQKKFGAANAPGIDFDSMKRRYGLLPAKDSVKKVAPVEKKDSKLSKSKDSSESAAKNENVTVETETKSVAEPCPMTTEDQGDKTKNTEVKVAQTEGTVGIDIIEGKVSDKGKEDVNEKSKVEIINTGEEKVIDNEKTADIPESGDKQTTIEKNADDLKSSKEIIESEDSSKELKTVSSEVDRKDSIDSKELSNQKQGMPDALENTECKPGVSLQKSDEERISDKISEDKSQSSSEELSIQKPLSVTESTEDVSKVDTKESRKLENSEKLSKALESSSDLNRDQNSVKDSSLEKQEGLRQPTVLDPKEPGQYDDVEDSDTDKTSDNESSVETSREKPAGTVKDHLEVDETQKILHEENNKLEVNEEEENKVGVKQDEKNNLGVKQEENNKVGVKQEEDNNLGVKGKEDIKLGVNEINIFSDDTSNEKLKSSYDVQEDSCESNSQTEQTLSDKVDKSEDQTNITNKDVSQQQVTAKEGDVSEKEQPLSDVDTSTKHIANEDNRDAELVQVKDSQEPVANDDIQDAKLAQIKENENTENRRPEPKNEIKSIKVEGFNIGLPENIVGTDSEETDEESPKVPLNKAFIFDQFRDADEEEDYADEDEAEDDDDSEEIVERSGDKSSNSLPSEELVVKGLKENKNLVRQSQSEGKNKKFIKSFDGDRNIDETQTTTEIPSTKALSKERTVDHNEHESKLDNEKAVKMESIKEPKSVTLDDKSFECTSSTEDTRSNKIRRAKTKSKIYTQQNAAESKTDIDSKYERTSKIVDNSEKVTSQDNISKLAANTEPQSSSENTDVLQDIIHNIKQTLQERSLSDNIISTVIESLKTKEILADVTKTEVTSKTDVPFTSHIPDEILSENAVQNSKQSSSLNENVDLKSGPSIDIFVSENEKLDDKFSNKANLPEASELIKDITSSIDISSEE
ncbi:uncharacterized protein LOC106867396, partial [Octopus bimaculoides]|uniref:uncharacterized protein LOC106867396 n=1 Tax=Octopus bimaculoides TaxID=37653 RepID=UPI0022E3F374